MANWDTCPLHIRWWGILGSSQGLGTVALKLSVSFTSSSYWMYGPCGQKMKLSLVNCVYIKQTHKSSQESDWQISMIIYFVCLFILALVLHQIQNNGSVLCCLFQGCWSGHSNKKRLWLAGWFSHLRLSYLNVRQERYQVSLLNLLCKNPIYSQNKFLFSWFGNLIWPTLSMIMHLLCTQNSHWLQRILSTQRVQDQGQHNSIIW